MNWVVVKYYGGASVELVGFHTYEWTAKLARLWESKKTDVPNYVIPFSFYRMLVEARDEQEREIIMSLITPAEPVTA